MEGATTWGNRFIQITLNWFGTNEFLQPVLVQVRPSSASGVPSALLLTNGYNAFPRVDLFDGPAGTSTAPPLNLNMTLYQGSPACLISLRLSCSCSM
jgi:hypothetical protein